MTKKISSRNQVIERRKKIGTHPTGEATFTVDGDTLTVEITMDHTSPNTQHWMHFHGFPDGKDAQPATIAQDTNHDGYVDLPETEPVSGTTMVPFNDAPEKMDIPTDTYPTSDANGHFHYKKEVPLAEISKKFQEVFNDADLHLEKKESFIFTVFLIQWNCQIPFKAQLANMINIRPYRLRLARLLSNDLI